MTSTEGASTGAGTLEGFQRQMSAARRLGTAIRAAPSARQVQVAQPSAHHVTEDRRCRPHSALGHQLHDRSPVRPATLPPSDAERRRPGASDGIALAARIRHVDLGCIGRGRASRRGHLTDVASDRERLLISGWSTSRLGGGALDQPLIVAGTLFAGRVVAVGHDATSAIIYRLSGGREGLPAPEGADLTSVASDGNLLAATSASAAGEPVWLRVGDGWQAIDLADGAPAAVRSLAIADGFLLAVGDDGSAISAAMVDLSADGR